MLGPKKKKHKKKLEALKTMDSKTAPTPEETTNTSTQKIKEYQKKPDDAKTLPTITITPKKRRGGLVKASKGVVVKMNNKSVPDNTKVDNQKSNASASGGVNPNFKSVVKKATSKGSGNANNPPSNATPTAKYGKMMKKGGAVKRRKKK